MVINKEKDLEDICFEMAVKDQTVKEDDLKYYFKIKKKKYVKNKEEKILIQVVDITKTILYEEVYAQNQFLAITNATVSHELRNPLQSICTQNLKINLCLKELINLISNNDGKTMKEMKKPIKKIVKMIQGSNQIQDSSANMMSFLVDDLLDFAQLNAGKFRKVTKAFNLREAIAEVVSVQKEKAKMAGINLTCKFVPQLHKQPKEIVSLFSDHYVNDQDEFKSEDSDKD